MNSENTEIILRFEEFGKQLCGDKHGWKKAFAERLHTDGQHINKIRNGQASIGGVLQARLRDLGADVDYIMTGIKRSEKLGMGTAGIQFSMEGFHSKEQADRYKEAMEKLDQIAKDDPEAAEKIIAMLDLMFKKK